MTLSVPPQEKPRPQSVRGFLVQQCDHESGGIVIVCSLSGPVPFWQQVGVNILKL
jgi:hypothetical protein